MLEILAVVALYVVMFGIAFRLLWDFLIVGLINDLHKDVD